MFCSLHRDVDPRNPLEPSREVTVSARFSKFFRTKIWLIPSILVRLEFLYLSGDVLTMEPPIILGVCTHEPIPESRYSIVSSVMAVVPVMTIGSKEDRGK